MPFHLSNCEVSRASNHATRYLTKSEPSVAIQEFPVPKSLKEVRQFLGLSSYYRRFIRGFAEVAHPLHSLTQKDAIFHWSSECQQAFKHLKDALVSPPVLAYPNFSKNFTLETDASIKGLGAVLSQLQDDSCLHPVAYASRSLSGAEKRYAITELETLAVICLGSKPFSCIPLW